MQNSRSILNIVHLANAITNYRNLILDKLELTAIQSDALRYILKNGDKDITAGDLMEELRLSQSTVAGIIKRLCEKDFIRKSPDALDSRRMLLRLTPKGLALKERLQEAADSTEERLFSGMTETERETFSRLTERVLENAKTIGNTKTGEKSNDRTKT